jgi:hypothetical protein
MCVHSPRALLFYTSGDGLLSVWDIRKPQLKAMSDCMDDELLSAVIVKVCITAYGSYTAT